MTDGRHFENRYTAISLRKIFRFSWHFVHSSRFWTGWTSRDQNWKSCIGQTPSRQNVFLVRSVAHLLNIACCDCYSIRFFFTILLTLGQISWIYLKLYNMVLVCVRHDVDTSTVWRKMLNQQTKNDNCAARGLLRCSTNWCWMFCSRLKEFCCTFSEKYFEKWLITAAVLYVHSQHKIMFFTTEGIERISCRLSDIFHSGYSVKAELCDRCCLLVCLSVCLSICLFVMLWAG